MILSAILDKSAWVIFSKAKTNYTRWLQFVVFKRYTSATIYFKLHEMNHVVIKK